MLPTLPMHSERKSTDSERYSTQPYENESELVTFETSPRLINYTSDNTVTPFDTDEEQILSIVRVSSTSVVNPNAKITDATSSASSNDTCNTPSGDSGKDYSVLRSKDHSLLSSNDRSILDSNDHPVLNSNNSPVLNSNEINGNLYSGGEPKNQKPLENVATPYVSLLRENRLDIDEKDPKEKLRALSTSRNNNYVPGYEIKFSRTNLDLKSNLENGRSSSPDVGSYRRSKSTYTEVTTDANTEATVALTVADLYRTLVEKEYEKTNAQPESDEEAEYADRRAGYEEPEKVYGEPEKVYGEPEKVYGEPEKVYGEPEKVYGEPEKSYEEPDKVYDKSEMAHAQADSGQDPGLDTADTNEFQLPESSEMNSKSYSSFTTKINDKKSSYIVDNGTYRKYRVEEKTADGFIVGEYGMVSHRDGSLRGVRYTADSNINPSLIYETLVKFLSLK